jgi:hypothetical protein
LVAGTALRATVATACVCGELLQVAAAGRANLKTFRLTE